MILPSTDLCYKNHSYSVECESYPLGIDEPARKKLAALSGAPPVVSWMQSERRVPWKNAADVGRFRRPFPMFITTTWHAPDPDNVGEQVMLHLASGVWVDIDAQEKRGETIVEAITALDLTANKLKSLGVPLECCSLFASGGKGFHVFVPLALMVPGGVEAVGIITARLFPRICKKFVIQALLTACTDLNIYNGGRGRLLRQAGVQRENGAFKVPMSWHERQGLTANGYKDLCNGPRPAVVAQAINGVAEGAAAVWLKVFKTVGKPPMRSSKPTSRQPGVTDFYGRLLPPVRQKIMKALQALPQDLAYADWIRVGMALKSTGAQDAFEIWSVYSLRYPGCRDGECQQRWAGLGGRVTLGTLFHLAKHGGGR